jgi:signal transduction histidine kinase/CheY-like chemotaxis protein
MSDLLRVLLVEDNPGDADLIVEMLPRDESTQFEVEVVARLAEALNRIGKERFDIILLDLGLPDSAGLGTLRAMQRQAAELPIVVLTGISDERMALAAIQEDAQDYLVKGQLGKQHLLRSIKYAVERKRAKEKLRASEEKYRWISQEYHALLDNLPDGIVQIAPDFKIIWANRAMTDMVTADEVQMKGNCCYQAFWDFKEPCGSCPVVRSFRSGELEEGNFTAPDGSLLELRAVPICDESGKVESVIEVIRDITEHRKLETQLRQAQKMESIGTFAGGIAHDFNNILTAIIGYGYMAQLKMGPDDPLRRNIELMLEGADRAAHLTKDLLLFSRKQVSEKTPVDLNEIVSHLEKFIVRIIGEDIVCRIGLPSEPIVVYADTHHLEQVLMNLATNARDAMPDGGELIISTEEINLGDEFATIHGYGKPGRYALLIVSDTGKGMDEEIRKKIFEPFFTTKEVGKGTGLGMAVVYGIIKQHEGYINIYSEPGIGTTFKIYLPLISSEERVKATAPREEILARGTETILLVEDDKSTRELISSVLKQQGYAVIEAVDGAVAVMKFMENRETIDLIISDLIMPKLNGKEAYDEMKVWHPELKVIFMSGYAPDAIREKMSLEENVELISKPILPNALLMKVRSVLDEGEK